MGMVRAFQSVLASFTQDPFQPVKSVKKAREMVCHRPAQPLCYGQFCELIPWVAHVDTNEATARERTGQRKEAGVADIFHEVEEDLRRDQALAFWKKYGNFVIAAALVVVLAVAGQWGWREYTTRQQLQASADFLSAAASSDLAQREAALGKLAAEGGTYAVLARFRLAETAIEAGDKAKARGILAEIAKDQDADQALRDLATIQAALLELEIGKPEAAADLVKDLTLEGQAYRLSALEITGLAAMVGGDTGKAKATFEEMKKLAAEAPTSGFARRADQLLDRLAN